MPRREAQRSGAGSGFDVCPFDFRAYVLGFGVESFRVYGFSGIGSRGSVFSSGVKASWVAGSGVSSSTARHRAENRAMSKWYR